jgi:group I intron endonuclease
MPLPKGFQHSRRTKMKISLSRKGNNGWTGRKHSKRTKKLMSLRRSGSGNPMFGKTLSEETRKKISEAKTKKSIK